MAIARLSRAGLPGLHPYDRALITAAVNVLPALLRVCEAAERLVENVLQVQRESGNVRVLIMAAAMTAKNRLDALDAAGTNQTTGESK
jgi:hypothetical protein